jgi:four helix bundle protein
MVLSGMAGFEELVVWRTGRALAVEVCRLTEGRGFLRSRSLADQLRRASISVPSNIAEGHQRKYRREFARFLTIALGSCAEVRTQLQIAAALMCADPTVCGALVDAFARLAARINRLRTSVLGQVDDAGD